MNLTAHMIVLNEENWVKYGIQSVLPYVDKFIIFDTGSIDNTVEIIKNIKSSKIIFEEKGKADAGQMVALRNEQIKKTKTKWFMLVDGDEIYPSRIFGEINLSDNYTGIYLKNHICVGDIYHQMSARYGRYALCGHSGHLNMRFYRIINGWQWWGEYPLEHYGPNPNVSINTMCDKLQFINDYYWHMSFMKRSSMTSRNHIKYDFGEKIKDQIPKIFDGKALRKRSTKYLFRSLLETPIRRVKNISQSI